MILKHLVRQFFHLVHFIVCLQQYRALGSLADDEVGVDLRQRLKNLKQADAIDRATGAGNSDDKGLFHPLTSSILAFSVAWSLAALARRDRSFAPQVSAWYWV